MENKLKRITSKIMLITSHIKEIADKSKSCLKGGEMTEVWNDLVSHMKLEERTEKSIDGGTQ